MTEDFILIAVVSLIWAGLAALYAFVPIFSMPGSAFVWGSGAAIFFALAAVIALSEQSQKAPLTSPEVGTGRWNREKK